MFTSFVGRGIFVRVLSSEYLGLGGYFGNIFSVISLCELGIGGAIAQSLYKPLADEDEYAVSAIVAFYSKICKRLALVTFAISMALLCFLPKIVKSALDIRTVASAFLLFSLHSAVSYILMPKCMLLICDQRMYVVSLVRSALGIVSLVLQSAALIMTKNYILYLALRILVITAGDIIVNIYADKKYPCLAMKMTVTKKYKKNLFSNVKALAWHKVGGVLSRSTDSILLTYFVGLSGMGKYSNYALVIGTIGAFFDTAINSVSASVGNLGAGDRGKKSECIMRRLYFMNFWLLTTGTCVIVCTLNPLISVWLGEEMLFTNKEMLVIVSSFYFSCIRDPVQIFVSAYGLFKESRFIPLLRALFNLVLSVVFVHKMGIAGVFLGTTLSTVLVPLFGEVLVLYKHGFSMKAGIFIKEMTSYIITSFVCVTLCFLTTYRVKTDISGLVMRTVSSFCLSNALLLILCSQSAYFSDASKLVQGIFRKMKRSDP